ncbi:alpha-ribazole phosphatase [Methylotuvimicrobium sp.]|uniref:alpha-ribazole phosphatase n=1 Tax=Methylotuvimicrobium sp. TaxID=2822413 RepID=UPI003D6549C8
MDIYLIRHTQTSAAQGLCYGRSDIALADSFAQEAEALRQKLPELSEDCRFYSSALSRCKRLADSLSDEVVTDERLLELDFGDWEGVFFNDIDAKSLNHWTQSFVDFPPPNGENFTNLCRRAGSFWQELIETELSQAVVVTHAGVIRALLTHILKLSPAAAFQFRVDHGSLHKFQYSHQYTYIHYLNL